MSRLVMLLLLLSSAGADTGLTVDTAVVQADEDGDGYDEDEDCDDNNAAINPGAPERCDDDDDNNCDGFFNEGCDNELQRGTLQGGQTCSTAAAAPWAWLWLGVLWWRRR